MVETMIERMSRAAESVLDGYGFVEDFGVRQAIRAAVEVMREPISAMTQKACDSTFGPSALTPEDTHAIGWRAMIDAALVESS